MANTEPEWGDRNYEAIYVCDGDWHTVPQNNNN